MAEVGSLSLYMALALAVYVAAGSVLGKLRSAPQLLESARRTTYLLPVVLGVAAMSMVLAFLRHDFQIEYVFEHSNLAMNPVYTWVAIYAGNEGSLLYIALVLSGLSALAVAIAPRSMGDSLPYTNAILMAVLIFFLGVMVTLANPFDRLPFAPADGRGINPLLTPSWHVYTSPGAHGRAYRHDGPIRHHHGDAVDGARDGFLGGFG